MNLCEVSERGRGEGGWTGQERDRERKREKREGIDRILNGVRVEKGNEKRYSIERYSREILYKI